MTVGDPSRLFIFPSPIQSVMFADNFITHWMCEIWYDYVL